MTTGADVWEALLAAGLTPYVRTASFDSDRNGKGTITGTVDLRVLTRLREHPHFQCGPWHMLHRDDIGEPCTEFRSLRGAFYPDRSLQVVVNTETGKYHADLDEFSAYADVVNIVGHVFGEVVPNRLKRWFRRG